MHVGLRFARLYVDFFFSNGDALRLAHLLTPPDDVHLLPQEQTLFRDEHLLEHRDDEGYGREALEGNGFAGRGGQWPGARVRARVASIVSGMTIAWLSTMYA